MKVLILTAILSAGLMGSSAFAAGVEIHGDDARTIVNMIGRLPVRGHLHILGFLTEKHSPRVEYWMSDFTPQNLKPETLPVNETLMSDAAEILARAGIKEYVDASGGTSYVHLDTQVECSSAILCVIE